MNEVYLKNLLFNAREKLRLDFFLLGTSTHEMVFEKILKKQQFLITANQVLKTNSPESAT
jgi:hypothetical protein